MAVLINPETSTLLRAAPRLMQIVRVLTRHNFLSALRGTRHWPEPKEVREAFEALVTTRPTVCRMTGSGSTLFAVYRSDRDRDDAAMMLGRKYGIVTAARTLAAPPNALTANANG